MSHPNSRTRALTRADFKLPIALVLLSIVPMLGGVVRLMSVAGNHAATAESARFVHSPVPVVIHIFSATLFAVLGAFQFSRAFRNRWLSLHRRVGRVVAVSGLLTGASGLWMTVFYDIPTSMQGPLLYAVRLVVGVAMIACLIMAWRTILRRDVQRHEAFMIRAYALAQGAGTQVLVLAPWMIISGESGGITRDVLMTLSWGINLAVAETIISRRRAAQRKAAPVLMQSEAA